MRASKKVSKQVAQPRRTTKSVTTKTEEHLRLRKLRAETELAERNLRESKKRWRSCENCGGHGVFKRCLGRTGSFREGWTYDLCTSCSGRGGHWIYEE
jgi:DnaJ-class molecular chaperone